MVCVLGPLQFTGSDQKVSLPGATLRKLFLRLLADREKYVEGDTLSEVIWGEPATSSRLRVLVSRLRQALEPFANHGLRISFRVGGYRLELGGVAVDVDHFDRLVRTALQAVGPNDRLSRAAEARRMWVGSPFSGDDGHPWLAPEIERLRSSWVAVSTVGASASAALGDTVMAVSWLRNVLEVEPYDEQVTAELALTLARGGRAAEALEILRRTRSRLADDLGLTPSPLLTQTELIVLNNNEANDMPTMPRAAPVPRSSNHIPGLSLPPALLTNRLVGRDSELAELRLATSPINIVVGPAGIGKSRILAELITDHVNQGGRAAYARCDEHSAGGFSTLNAALGESIALSIDGSSPTALADVSGDLANQIDQVLGKDRRLLAIDDAQFLSPDERSVVAKLARRAHTAARRIVLCIRTTAVHDESELVDTFADLCRDGFSSLLPLTPLAAHDVETLVKNISPQLTTTAITAIAQRADGTPLFASELAKEARFGQQERQMKGTLRSLFARRLASITNETFEFLTVAAVVGREFDHHLVSDIQGCSVESVIAGCDELRSLGLLHDAANGSTGYRFAHDLLREFVIGELSLASLEQRHLRTANAMLQHPGDYSSLHVGIQFEHSGPSGAPQAVFYLLRAAEEALDACSYATAAELAERAEVIARRSVVFSVPGALALQGLARRHAGELELGRRLYMEAAGRAAELGDSATFASLTLDAPGSWVDGQTLDLEVLELLRKVEESATDDDHRLRASARIAWFYFPRRRSIRQPIERIVEGLDCEFSEHISERARYDVLAARSIFQLGLPVNNEMLALVEALDEADRRLPRSMRTGFADAQRAVFFSQLGEDERVDMALENLALTAAETKRPIHQWRSATCRSAVLLHRGEINEATSQARRAREIGASIKHADAEVAYSLFAFRRRWLDGTLGALLPVMTPAVDSPGDPVWDAAAALTLASCGQIEHATVDAERVLNELNDLPLYIRSGTIAILDEISLVLPDLMAREFLPLLDTQLDKHVVLGPLTLVLPLPKHG